MHTKLSLNSHINLWIAKNQVLIAKYSNFSWFKNILWNLKKTNKVKNAKDED